MKRILVATAVLLAAVLARATDLRAVAYVQDGLLGLWDAIENAGAGVHDTSATTWVDLSGHGHDITLPSSGVTVSDATVSLSKVSVKTFIDEFLADGSFSGEAYVRATSDYTTSDICRSIFSNSRFSLWFRNTSGLLGSHYTNTRKRYCYAQTKPSVAFIKAWHSYYAQASSAGGAISIDGAAPAAVTAQFYDDAFTANTNFAIGTSYVTLDYRSVRLYNRHLTANEIAYNRLVDRIRFDGEIPEGHRVSEDGSKIQYFFSVTNTADEAVLSLDGGETWFAATNRWIDYGTSESVTVTVKEDARGRFAFFEPAGKGTWNRAAGTFTVTVTGPTEVFARPAAAYTWTGGNGFFDDPAHWTGGFAGTVPGVLDSATIATADAAFTVTVTNPLELVSLTVTGDEKIPEDPADDLFATVKFQTGLATNLFGAVTVNAAGKLTHASGGTAETQKLIFSVTGNVTVAANGRIDATGCGYSAGYGPGANTGPNNWKVGSHGGEGAEHTVEKCYGSIRYPSTYGSGGQYTSGGGAIRMLVAGKLTVNGTVTAQGSTSSVRSGAGGSVWIDCGELAGSGSINADASNVNDYKGGGGRVAVKLTKEGATFSAWSGSMRAVSFNTTGSAGTVYQQTAAQADGFGTLIVDNGGNTSKYYASVNGNVTEADVGDLLVRNGGKLRLAPDGTLTVRGSIANSGTIQCEVGSTLTLASPLTCNVAGKVNAYRLVCEEPGKKIVTGTTASDGLSILADGFLTLAGSAEHPIEMLPALAAGFWTFTVNAGTVKDVRYVSVSNCNGSAGCEVIDFGGTDQGGNTKWLFPAPLVPGVTNAWTGATSADPGLSSNWTLGRPPEPCDVVRVPSGTVNALVLTSALTTYNTLIVETGATLTLDGARLVITNDLSVAGSFVLKGARTVEVGRNLTLAGPSCLKPDASLVTFTGASGHRMDANGAAFYRLELAADCGDVTFASGWTASRFRSRPGVAARTLTFAGGALFEAECWILEGGTDATPGLTLASSGATAWRMKATHAAYARGLSVSGSDAQTDGGIAVKAYESSGTGTNPGWTFASGDPFVWTGAASANFAAAGNWESGAAPGAADAAWVFAKGANAPVASAATSVGSLVVGGGDAAVTFKNTATVTVARAVHVIENGTATCDALFAVTGDVRVAAGGVMKHSSNDYLELKVTRNLWVDSNGDVNLVGLSTSTKSAGSVNDWQASYGGEGASGTKHKCYGSIRRPSDLGSKGAEDPGGGRLRAQVGGTATVNGRIRADASAIYRTGTGGSVWIDCARLLGSGWISADSATGSQFSSAGGRVAVKLTDPTADFSTWTGTITAYGKGSSAAGTVYLQTGAQADGFGTLIVDNDGRSSTADTVVNADVTEADVGDLVIRRAGRFRIDGGASLTVNGSITNGGTFTANADSLLVLASTNDCRLKGTLSLFALSCVAPGKRIYGGTGKNDAVSVQENGFLTLEGSAEKPLLLLPEDGTGTWKFTVNGAVTKLVTYANPSNCNSSAGYDIASFGGTDLGGNQKWSFPEVIVPGTTNAWIGATDSDPNTAANWALGRGPEPTDYILVKGSAAHMPTLSGALTTWNSLEIEDGATLTLTGDRLVVTNCLTVAGRLVVSGSRTITVGRDLALAAPTCLVSDVSLVTVTGAGSHRVDAHGAAFYRLELAADCGDVTFASGWTATRFRSRPGAAARTLTFAGGALFESEGWILEGGSDASPGLTFASADATAWRMKARQYAYARGLAVSGSDAQTDGGIAVKAYESSGTGTNPGWTFTEDAPCVWTGAASATFAAAGNWESGAAPGAADDAWVFAKGANAPVLSATATVGSLVVGGGDAAVTFRNTATMTVARVLHVLENGTATCDALLAVTGDVRVAAGGVMKHSSDDYLELAVHGNMTVDKDGAVNLTGLSYSSRGCGTSSYYASYGGEGAATETEACYGSIRHPNLGGPQGVNGDPGGGRIRAVVDGLLTVNGGIRADAYKNWRSGTGGSVWIDCGSLAGGGAISADSVMGSQFGSAGGRVAVKLTDPSADFSAWTGTITAYGKGTGAAGTVYLQTGAQEDGFGTLIVDNGNLSVTAYTSINTDVTETEVGDVIIRRGGRLKIATGGSLTVNGSITNGGAFTVQTGSDVILASTNDCHLTGSAFSFYRLACEVPGKTVYFPTNAKHTVTIQENGTFALTGTAEEPIRLVPSAGGAGDFWRLTLGAGVDRSLTWVAVSNSIASTSVTSFGNSGLDLGGNTNWSFENIIMPGEEIVWTGKAGTSDMEDALNWDRKRRPEKTDAVIIAPADVAPVLTAQSTLFNSLEIRSGASFTVAGSELVLTNDLVVNGALAMSGANTLRVAGSVAFGAQASLAPASSVFSLTGGMDRTVSAAGVRFNILELDPTCGNVSLSGSFGAETLYSRAGETVRTLTFADGTHVTVNGIWLDGVIAGDKGLTLTTPTNEDAARWRLDVDSWSFVRGVRVKGSDASHGTQRVTAYRPCLDEGGNSGWTFETDRDPALWKGGTDLNFGTAANWASGVVPGAEDAVYMPYTAGTVTMTAYRQTFKSFVLGGSGDGRTAVFQTPRPFTVRENLQVLRDGTAFLDAAVTVTGDVSVAAGGTITHSGPSGSESAGVDLTAAGNVSVAFGGAIDVKGRGFSATSGPGASNGNNGGTHAGKACQGLLRNADVYGSLCSPTNCGSGGDREAGGGRIRIFAAGTVTVNGAVTADGAGKDRAGAGGSVWVRAAALAGSGSVTAKGGSAANCQFFGGGGRLAIETTDAAGTNAWTGVTSVAGGNANAGCGSIFWKLKGERYGTAYAGGGKQGTRFGGPLADTPKVARDVKLVLLTGPAQLMGNWMVRDLDLRANAALAISNKILTVKATDHKRGRGWSPNATVTSNTVDGVTGRIEWVPPGTVIVVK